MRKNEADRLAALSAADSKRLDATLKTVQRLNVIYLEDVANAESAAKLLVKNAERTTNDIIFEREFRELAVENPNFNFYVTCTRLHPEDKWTGRRGRIDPVWVREQIHDLPNTVFYACGPNPLVEFAEELVLHGLNVPKEQMKTEKWG